MEAAACLSNGLLGEEEIRCAVWRRWVWVSETHQSLARERNRTPGGGERDRRAERGCEVWCRQWYYFEGAMGPWVGEMLPFEW